MQSLALERGVNISKLKFFFSLIQFVEKQNQNIGITIIPKNLFNAYFLRPFISLTTKKKRKRKRGRFCFVIFVLELQINVR